jgi:hypothetical protein
MSIDDLRTELQHRKIPAFAYSIGQDQNETYCIIAEHGEWHVYYSERGARNSEQVYISEADACDELMRRVLGDRAIQQWMAEHGA